MSQTLFADNGFTFHPVTSALGSVSDIAWKRLPDARAAAIYPADGNAGHILPGAPVFAAVYSGIEADWTADSGDYPAQVSVETYLDFPSPEAAVAALATLRV